MSVSDCNVFAGPQRLKQRTVDSALPWWDVASCRSYLDNLCKAISEGVKVGSSLQQAQHNKPQLHLWADLDNKPCLCQTPHLWN